MYHHLPGFFFFCHGGNKCIFSFWDNNNNNCHHAHTEGLGNGGHFGFRTRLGRAGRRATDPGVTGRQASPRHRNKKKNKVRGKTDANTARKKTNRQTIHCLVKTGHPRGELNQTKQATIMPSIHPQRQKETESSVPHPRFRTPARCAAPQTHTAQQQQGFCNQNNFFSSFLASSAAHRGKMAPEEHAWRGRGVAAPLQRRLPLPCPGQCACLGYATVEGVGGCVVHFQGSRHTSRTARGEWQALQTRLRRCHAGPT